MNIMVIMHAASEGSGTIGEFLESIQAKVQIVRLYEGDNLPDNIQNLKAIIALGGPMNVYQENEYPFLKEETIFLQKAIEAKTPVLGICLGAQLIAKACGAAVTKSPNKEIGWSDVSLTKTGCRDLLFHGLSRTLRVFQWHEDTFDVPISGSLLATSPLCTNQAFRCHNAYGLQFHVEVTSDMIMEWFADSPEQKEMLSHFDEMQHHFTSQAQRIYSNFISLINR